MTYTDKIVKGKTIEIVKAALLLYKILDPVKREMVLHHVRHYLEVEPGAAYTFLGRVRDIIGDVPTNR